MATESVDGTTPNNNKVTIKSLRKSVGPGVAGKRENIWSHRFKSIAQEPSKPNPTEIDFRRANAMKYNNFIRQQSLSPTA